jgi:5-methylcytosine-specific restriction endonuclease McrA
MEVYMSVAENVYRNIGAIIQFCNNNPTELNDLLNINRSKQLFDINFSFFIETQNIDDTNGKRSSLRYKADVFSVCNKLVRVTNDWYSRNMPYLLQYFKNNNLNLAGTLNPAIGLPTTNTAAVKNIRLGAKNSRYKSHAIGNAQNSVIRNILGNLGIESFSESDWKATITYFGNKCAYCGSTGELVMDHAIPINKEKLGEHRLGNIVPSCPTCNNKKSDKDYREFLGDKFESIRFIDKYMEEKNYTPLEDNENIKKLLAVAYEEVSAVAERYIDIINDLFINKNSE